MMKQIIFTLLLVPQFIFAQNCFSEWGWYRPLTVHNTSSDDVMDAAFPFDLNTNIWVGENKLQADGSDLRITDANCDPIPYFMDSVANASGNVIWIKVPMIPANDSIQLQMYYGNDSASAVASGDDVFMFYDDFSADSVNPDKWEAIGEYTNFKVVNGVLNYSSTGSSSGSRFKFARTKMIFDEAVFFDFRSKVSNSNGMGFSSSDSILTRILFRQAGFGFDTLNQVAYNKDTVSNGFQIEGMYPLIRFPRGEFRNGRIRAGIQDSLLTMDYFANLDENSATDSVYQMDREKMSGFHFILSSFSGTQTIFLDYLRVRKPTPEGINVTIGEEAEIMSTSVEEEAFGFDITIAPNPTYGDISIAGLPSGKTDLQLFNLQGQVLLTKSVIAREGQALELSLPELTAGMYWLSVSTDTGGLISRGVMLR